MVISFKVDAFFANYLLGNNGAEMVECLERQIGAKIKVQQDEVVLMDTDDLTKRERIETELVKAWHQDDFERALEVTKIAEMSETFESFTLPVQEAALVERRAKTLARNSGVDAIKVHGTGIVTVFGTQFAVVKARCAISDVIKGENLASTPTTPTQDGEAGKNSAASQDSTGPCTLSFWVPERAARLVIGRGGHNVDEFERIHRCLIEVRTPEKNADGNVPVDITSKNIKSTYDAKDALFRFLDRHIPNRDWPVRVDIRCADPIP
uniref:K Homology domain-containing protein n=1 Tax=Plectus sambesii TaxID=2011161 RepID=A0A914X7X2_9BILA